MICAKCGNPLDEGTKFCLFCGAVQDTSELQLELDETSAESPVESEYSTSQTPDIDEILEEVAASNEETDIPAREEKPIKAKPVKKTRKPSMRAGATAVICVLFSVLTLVFGLVSSGLWITRDLLEDGAASTVVSETNYLYRNAKDILTNVPELEKARKDSGIAEISIGEIGETETVGDVLDRTMTDYGLTADKAEQLLAKENTKLNSYIKKIISAYEVYLLTGEDVKAVNARDIKETVLSCMNYAAGELGFKFRPDYEQRIDTMLRANKDAIRAANPTEALGVGGSYIRYIFSYPVLAVSVILALLFAVLAGVITRRADVSFITLGIPMLICGLLFLYVGLFPRVVISRMGITSAAVADVTNLFNGVFTQIGLAETVIGVLAIAVFVVWRVIASKRKSTVE